MAEMKLKPDIRFAGFADAWERRKVSDVVDVRSGQDYKHLSDGDIPVYGTGGYMLSVDKALSYSENAIGIGRKGTIDKPYLLRAPFWTVDTLFYAVPRKSYDLDFAHTVFQRIDWKQKDESTGVPSLSKTTINSIDILTPITVEQKQIGGFFAKIDTLITVHQREYDKTVNIKKAMLEKMFPKDGVDRPEIRFAGFTDAWERRKLGDSILECTERTKDFKQYFLYSLTIEKGVTKKTERYERSFLVRKDTDLFKIVPPNCFVTNPMNLRFGAVGYNDNRFAVSVSGYYDVFSIDDNECSEFWYAYFKTNRAMKKYDDVATGSLIEKRRVHFSELKRIEFLAPTAVKEKKKIGTFFSALDNLITLHQHELKKLQNMKKALLEKMFV